MFIFLERFVIAVCVAVCGVALVNPLGLGVVQRVSLAVAAIAIAVFAAWTIESRMNDNQHEGSISKLGETSARDADAPDGPDDSSAESRLQGNLERLPVSDTEAPRLIGFAIPSREIDTRRGPAAIEFMAHVVDDLAGVAGDGYSSSPTQVRFRSPSGQQFVDVIFGSPQLVEGTLQNGRYRYIASLPRFSEAGTWSLEYFLLVDQTGNMNRLDAAAVQKLRFPTTFTLLR